MTRPRILVTGATGSTGSAVVEQLLAREWPVRALVHRLDDRAHRLRSLGAEVVAADLFDAGRLADALLGVERAYHNSLQLIGFAAHLGVLPNPFGDSRNAPPSNADIARVAVAALIDPDRHAGRTYRPTGPELLDAGDMAAFGRVLRPRVRPAATHTDSPTSTATRPPPTRAWRSTTRPGGTPAPGHPRSRSPRAPVRPLADLTAAITDPREQP